MPYRIFFWEIQIYGYFGSVFKVFRSDLRVGKRVSEEENELTELIGLTGLIQAKRGLSLINLVDAIN